MASEKEVLRKMISIKEFKMWLEGVEEMQADDWTPDNRQWKRIRDKIDLIREEEPPVRIARESGSSGNVHIPGMESVFPPMNTNPPGPGASEPGPSSLNAAGPTTPQPPRAMATSTKSGMPVALSKGDGQVKTPDIDTSNGKYNSGFE